MKIAFVDVIDWDYDIASPLERPLGGSQSGLCYLARELVERGHEVALICGTTRPGEVLGVQCVSFVSVDIDWIRTFDRIVVLNGPSEVWRKIKPHIAPEMPLVLWTQHAPNQPAMSALRDAETRDAWNQIVCLTEWHRRVMIEHYELDPARVFVIRNAMSPLFENLFADSSELGRVKPAAPILAFTSTPFRGLDLLLYAFPHVRAEFPDARLHVYSSMNIYQQPSDPYAPLYDYCRTLPGCVYFGSVNQPRLAAELRRAAVLAYTNTFAETACIAAMEAMASGMYVVTTDLGALSETLLGFGRLIPPVSESDVDLTGPSTLPPVIAGHRLPTLGESAYVRRYGEAIKQVLRRRADDPVGFHAEMWEQIQTVRRQYNWRTRAAEWEAFLQGT